MIDIKRLEGTDHPSFYAGVLKSLREFDRLEVEGVISGLFGITKREECFYAIYLRAQRNVCTLLELKQVGHFQAIAMISRSMFELRMDAELLLKTPDGDLRMRTYKSLELLRAARSLVKYEDSQTSNPPPSERRRYISEVGTLVEQEAHSLWPGKKLSELKHWTGLNVAQRAKSLGSETETMYISSYQQFSWYVHGGIQGTLDATPDHFPRICGIGLSMSAISYSRLLEAVARAVRITTHDQNFDRKLELALALPMTETVEDERKLRRDLAVDS